MSELALADGALFSFFGEDACQGLIGRSRSGIALASDT
jgi:hypothetical protein